MSVGSRPSSPELENILHRAVAEKTNGCVQRLVVLVEPTRIVVSGEAPTYYAAQLALSAAQAALRKQSDPRPVRLAITVAAGTGESRRQNRPAKPKRKRG